MSEKRVIVVGAGVIGLSLAFELAERGRQVTLLEKESVGKQASWAGAGILAPANLETAVYPLDQLAGLSNQLHPKWSARLKELTGIDNGYAACGGVYVARSAGDAATLAGTRLNWDDFGIENCALTPNEVAERVPVLQIDDAKSMVWVPGEAQICNPIHLQALAAACKKLGVEIIEQVETTGLDAAAIQSKSIKVAGRELAFDQICFAAGVWTSELLEQISVRLPLVPVRGQMLLFKLPEMLWQPIINEGTRYIVPRQDGHVLVGSTTEEAGFDCRTTSEQIDDLQKLAEDLIPQLTIANRIKKWAGLRPASFDGMPFIGRLAGWNDVFVSSGHFKTGLQLSTASSVVLADEMDGVSSQISLAPFSVARMDHDENISG